MKSQTTWSLSSLLALPALALLALSKASSEDLPQACDTSNSCEIGQNCTCTVPANSYRTRFFYFNATPIESGNNYSCHLDGMLGIYEGASVPEGAKVECEDPCRTFPVRLTIDASNMTETNGSAQVKFQAPPSDTSWGVTFGCEG